MQCIEDSKSFPLWSLQCTCMRRMELFRPTGELPRRCYYIASRSCSSPNKMERNAFILLANGVGHTLHTNVMPCLALSAGKAFMFIVYMAIQTVSAHGKACVVVNIHAGARDGGMSLLHQPTKMRMSQVSSIGIPARPLLADGRHLYQKRLQVKM